jgi:hypothetical protein
MLSAHAQNRRKSGSTSGGEWQKAQNMGLLSPFPAKYTVSVFRLSMYTIIS